MIVLPVCLSCKKFLDIDILNFTVYKFEAVKRIQVCVIAQFIVKHINHRLGFSIDNNVRRKMTDSTIDTQREFLIESINSSILHQVDNRRRAFIDVLSLYDTRMGRINIEQLVNREFKFFDPKDPIVISEGRRPNLAIPVSSIEHIPRSPLLSDILLDHLVNTINSKEPLGEITTFRLSDLDDHERKRTIDASMDVIGTYMYSNRYYRRGYYRHPNALPDEELKVILWAVSWIPDDKKEITRTSFKELYLTMKSLTEDPRVFNKCLELCDNDTRERLLEKAVWMSL